MKTPIRTHKTAELYMQQGYFEEAREVLQALEAENPSDYRLPDLYKRLEELIKDAEINPPIQQLERMEENLIEETALPDEAYSTVKRRTVQTPSCCTNSAVSGPRKILVPQGSRTQRLAAIAADVGIDVAQRAVSKFVKGLNRVITRIQERKGGL